MNSFRNLLLAAVFLLFCAPSFGQSAQISYLTPDIGTNNFNTYVEIIGPYNAKNNFGPDAVYANNLGDNVRVVALGNTPITVTIGPVIVGWQGRMISTQIFIGSCPTPNSSDWRALTSDFRIPIAVIVGGKQSNIDTFYVVKPNSAIKSSNGGLLGSGGPMGVRSRRGAMLFDSLDLAGGTFYVSTADCDPNTPGNQGYLPATVLSVGPVRLGPTATLDVSAFGKDAGPGGGGGSMGDGPVTDSGGFGFVGGSPGESMSGKCPSTGGTGTGGYGSVVTGGIGLNGVPTEPSDVPQCQYYGGTGNPFVSSGGGVLSHAKHEGDGCGGGFGTSGDNAQGARGNAIEPGGIKNGNNMLVPLMGGSGGGGGNEFCTCDGVSPGARGGGGGGGLALYGSRLLLSGAIHSVGAPGVSGGSGCVNHASVGGSGSGGGIILGSKLFGIFPTIDVSGAISPHAHVDAGNGGAGRVRTDGPSVIPPVILPAVATTYTGLSTDTTSASGPVSITGTNNGATTRIYVKHGSNPWSLQTTIPSSTPIWTANVDAAPSEATYVVAMQSVALPSVDTATLEPQWVMSQSATNMLGSSSNGTDFPLATSFQFPQTPGCERSQSFLALSIGCVLFVIDSASIAGDTAKVFSIVNANKLPEVIPFGKSDSIFTLFNPNHRIGNFGAKLHVYGHLQTGTTRIIYDSTIALLARSIPSPPNLQPLQSAVLLSVNECKSLDTTFRFANNGCDTIRIDSIALFHTAGITIGPVTTPMFLPPGGVSNLPIHYSPSSGTLDSLGGKMFFSSDTYVDSIAVTLSGHAVASQPTFSLSTSDVNFGSVSDCAGHDTTIVIRNTGCSSLRLDSLSIPSGAFTVLNNILPVTLPVDSVIVLHIHYKSRSSSDKVQLTIFGSHSWKFVNHVINVHGGINFSPNILQTSVPDLQLSAVAICQSIDTVIRVKNTTCDTIVLTQADLDKIPSLRMIGQTPPITLPPDSSLPIELLFTPDNVVSGSGRLHFMVTVGSYQQPSDILINVNGTAPHDSVLLRNAVMTFKQISICESDTAMAFMDNIGCDTIQITGIDISGGDLVLLNTQQVQTLLPGSTLQIRAGLTPTKKGLHNGSVTIHYFYHSDPTQKRDTTISVSGIVGDGTRTLQLSNSRPIDLGALTLCDDRDTTITLSNNGCDTITVSNMGLTGRGLLSSSPGSFKLLPGESRTLHVSSTLDTAGGVSIFSGQLAITSNADNPSSQLTFNYTRSYPASFTLYLDKSFESGKNQSTHTYRLLPSRSIQGLNLRQLDLDVTHDNDVLSSPTINGVNKYVLTPSISGGITSDHITITGSPIQQNTDSSIASITYTAFLSKNNSSTISLESVVLNNGDPSYRKCVATATTAAVSEFDFQNECGDSTLRYFLLNGTIALSIDAVYPNPVGDILNIQIANHLKVASLPISVSISDMLGRQLMSVQDSREASSSRPTTLDLTGLPSGPLALAIESSGGRQSRLITHRR